DMFFWRPARQDLVADDDQRGCPDFIVDHPNSVRPKAVEGLPLLCVPEEKNSPSTSSGQTVGFAGAVNYIGGMTQYITVAADDRAEAKNGIIKLHGPEG